MQESYIHEIEDNFNDYLTKLSLANIKRTEAGFISTDENSVKTMLSAITIHALPNLPIFNDEQLSNIMFIINSLTNG